MRLIRPVFINVFLLILLLLSLSASATTAEPTSATEALTGDQIEKLLNTLEDEEQRKQLITSLRILAQATEKTTDTAESANFKTAAADLLEQLATKIEGISQSISKLLGRVHDIPEFIDAWREDLKNPDSRRRWLMTLWRLFAVLGSGFAAAALIGWSLRRFRKPPAETRVLSLLSRITRLVSYLILNLLPIILFAAVSYTALAFVDPRQETRLVAVALINASILSRSVLAISAFFLAPGAPHLRLWRISDESSEYAHHWIKRLSLLAIYGYFGLQAGLLLGLESGVYETLLRLLGLVILGMLLVLIAQNREDVAKAIASERATDSGEPLQLSSLRKGLARIWHLLASLYLVVIYGIWTLQIEEGAQYLLKATLLSLLVLAVGRLLAHAIDHLFDRGLRLTVDLREQYPGLEERLNRYFPALRKIMKVALSLIVVLGLANAWGLDALHWVTEGSGKILLAAILNILFILGVALLLWEFSSGWIERYLSEKDQTGNLITRSPRIRTLLTVARNVLMVVLTLVSVLMILSELGINIAPLLAGAGVVGLAIGFGAQRLVQDVINGAFILFQDLMSVGDVVKLGDKAGVVEALSIRTVRLRDLAGVVHTIPFSSIEGVSNLTREYSFHVFDLGIAYREDVDAAIELVRQIGEELRADSTIGPLILEPIEVFGLDAFGASAIMIKGRIKTQPIKQWQVGRAFNRLVKQRFDEQGIEIPFPHQTIYFGQDKDGSAPPAFIQLESLLRDKTAE